MPDDKCKWESENFPEYQCLEPPLEGDENGWCILHSEKEDKEIQKFTDKVNERITKGRLTPSGWETDKIDLVGCYFPEKFPAYYFMGRTFDRPIDFRGARFSQEVYFGGATFSLANFGWARFLKAADFGKTTFSWAYFIGARFSKVADFHRAIFSQADFSGITFSKGVDFGGATFSKAAGFLEAEFLQGANFSGAMFSQGAYFIGATFSQADFNKAKFSKRADFFKAKFSWADFEGTVFKEKARFDHAEFRERVFFAPLGEGNEKRDTEFGPGSSFLYTRFLGEVRFQEVDLRQCSFLHSNIDKVDFRYCEFGKGKGRQNVLKDERDCIKNVKDADKGPFPYNGRVFIDTAEEKRARDGYEPAYRLYTELKKNFEDKRDWNTAGDFHYGEMECRRNMKEGWLWRNILSLEAVYFWLSGYGERPLRASVILCIFVLFLFPLLLVGNDCWPYISGSQSFCFWNCVWAFYDSVKDSFRLATFTTVTKIGEQIKPDTGWDNVFLVLESIIVYVQILLLALALRRKVKR